VQSAPGFVSDVRRFVDKHSSAGDGGYNWALLEFSELGFIGKLLRFSRHCHLDPCCARRSGRSRWGLRAMILTRAVARILVQGGLKIGGGTGEAISLGGLGKRCNGWDGFSWHHNSANIECVSARISLGVLFYIAKKIFSQLFGGGGVEPVSRLKYGPHSPTGTYRNRLSVKNTTSQ